MVRNGGGPVAKSTERTTVYLDTELHKALRVRAAVTRRPVSVLVNQAVRALLQEDSEDLAAFDQRRQDVELSYEELLTELRANGAL